MYHFGLVYTADRTDWYILRNSNTPDLYVLEDYDGRTACLLRKEEAKRFAKWLYDNRDSKEWVSAIFDDESTAGCKVHVTYNWGGKQNASLHITSWVPRPDAKTHDQAARTGKARYIQRYGIAYGQFIEMYETFYNHLISERDYRGRGTVPRE